MSDGWTEPQSSKSRLRRLPRRIIRGLRYRARTWSRLLAVHVWRRLMFRTTVIAITGSVGKSTAKECLAAILSSQARTHKTRNNENDRLGVPRTVFAMRPWHRFAVIELGVGGPGDMGRLARLARPDIALVLAVARTHTRNFPTLEDTAAEKAKLLHHLPPGGVAILNADDERVRGMAEQCRCKVVFYGALPGTDFSAEQVSSSWPERLGFELRARGAVTPVRTRLVGTHWLSSILAAVAAADACGVPIPVSAAALAGVPPFTARMQPILVPSGAVVVRDEENGSPDTLDAMLKVMRESRAQRRILVISDISDSKVKQRKRHRDLGRIAAEVADVAVFVSGHGHHGVRAALEAGGDAESFLCIPDLERAAEFLKSELRDGDLVFVKGKSTDHLSRVVFAQYGSVGCWRTACRIHHLCDVCHLLQPGFDLERALSERAV